MGAATTAASAALRRGVGPGGIAALLAAMIAWTWRRWPDPIVDFGQQLYNGWQIAEGGILYRDVGWVFGPLSQHVVAGWFRLAGTSLLSMVWLNLIVLAATATMAYLLVSAIAGRAAATAAGLVFAAVFACGQYSIVSNYNYLTPYAVDATHGMAISLAALLLVLRFARTGEPRAAAGIGVCLGLLFLNKPEYFVAAGAGALAGMAGTLRRRRASPGAWGRTAALAALASLLPIAAAGAWLASIQDLPSALSALWTPWRLLGAGRIADGGFYEGLLGFADVGGYAGHLAAVLGVHVAVLLPALLVALRCRPGHAALAGGLATGSAAGALLWVAVPPLAWLGAVAPLPLEMAAVAVWAGVRQCRRADGSAGVAEARLAAAAFAMALLVKTLLNTQTGHYGFVLAMPATLIAISALIGWVPARIDAVGGSGLAFRCAVGVVLAVFVLAHWRIESRLMNAKVHVVGEGADRFRADSRGRNLNAAVEAIRSLTGTKARIFVLPEGTMINYLARRRNPGPLFGYIPNGFVEEQAVLRMLAEQRPEAVVLTDRPVTEFGVGPLGVGYGQQVMAFVDRQYRLAAQFGPSPLVPGGDGIAVLLRRDYRP